MSSLTIFSIASVTLFDRAGSLPGRCVARPQAGLPRQFRIGKGASSLQITGYLTYL